MIFASSFTFSSLPAGPISDDPETVYGVLGCAERLYPGAWLDGGTRVIRPRVLQWQSGVAVPFWLSNSIRESPWPSGLRRVAMHYD